MLIQITDNFDLIGFDVELYFIMVMWIFVMTDLGCWNSWLYTAQSAFYDIFLGTQSVTEFFHLVFYVIEGLEK